MFKLSEHFASQATIEAEESHVTNVNDGSAEPTNGTGSTVGHTTTKEPASFDAAIRQVKSLKKAAAERGIGHQASTEIETGVGAVKVRKPKPHEWVRVHPDIDDFSLVLPVIRFGDEGGSEDDNKLAKPDEYVIHPVLQDHPDLSDDANKLKEFHLAITRKGTLFIWPHTVLDAENLWLDTEAKIIQTARKQWVRQISDTREGMYRGKQSAQKWADPKWPTDLSFEDLLVKGLGDKFVASTAHPLFDKLLGRD
jgi:hypothetical protein